MSDYQKDIEQNQQNNQVTSEAPVYTRMVSYSSLLDGDAVAGYFEVEDKRTRKFHCAACLMVSSGVKSRKALLHTCGK